MLLLCGKRAEKFTEECNARLFFCIQLLIILNYGVVDGKIQSIVKENGMIEMN